MWQERFLPYGQYHPGALRLLPIPLCFLGVVWVAGDARKQGWHDKLAHTLVIRTWHRTLF